MPRTDELHATRTGSRVALLTNDAHKRIIGTLQAGNHLDIAAAVGGVETATVRAWVRKGQAEHTRREAGKKPDPTLDIYVVFAREFGEALVTAEALAVSRLTKAGETDWRASLAFLERKEPKRWGLQVNLHVTQELEAFLDALERRLPRDVFVQVLRAADDEAREGTSR